MRVSLSLYTILPYVIICSHSEVVIPPEHRFFAQRLDHFDRNNTRIWQQKFYIKTIYGVDNNAPNILAISDFSVQASQAEEGFFVEQAKKLKTNLFVIDIRFFGFSRPTEDLAEENLKYATVDQMIADMEYFMRGMNEYLIVSRDPYQRRNQKWIVQGCGVSAILAIIARIKHPDIVVGAVAVGAPLPIVEYSDYFKNIFNSIKEKSAQCMDNIRDGFIQLDAISRTSSAAQELGDAFELCSITENQSHLKDQDISILFYLIAHNIGSQVVGRETDIGLSLDDICKVMNAKDNGSPYKRLAQVHESLRMRRHQECTPLYDDYIKKIRDVSFGAQAHEFFPILRQRKYSQCLEIGLMTTSKETQDIFIGNKISLEFLLGVCKDSFSTWNLDIFNKNMAHAAAYASENLPNLTNVAFVYQKDNPFRNRFYRTTSAQSVNIDIPGTGVCDIFEKSSLRDSRELVQGRKQILNLVQKWAADARQ